MALTKVTGNEIKESTITADHIEDLSITEDDIGDGEITRAKLNTADAGKAVIIKIAVGTGLKIDSSSGADPGTGDVQISPDGIALPADILLEPDVGAYSSKRKGSGHAVAADYSASLAGKNNDITATGPYSGIFTGHNNVIQEGGPAHQGSHNTILGGYHNVIGGNYNTQYSTISGGYGNTLRAMSTGEDGIGSFIGAGKSNTASGAYAAVITGLSNQAQLGGFIGAGQNNQATGSKAFIGSGSTNVVQGQDSAIVTGDGNTVLTASGLSLIGAGYHNSSKGWWDVIGGGHGNVISNGSSCIIGGGKDNEINPVGATTTLYGVIVGGNNNSLQGGNESIASVIVGGDSNVIVGADYVSILGGKTNTVGVGADYAVVIGGLGNEVDSAYGFIGAGDSNQVGVAANRASIVAGSANLVSSGNDSFIGGGDGNVIDMPLAVIGGGYQNNIDDCENAVIAGGAYNTINTTIIGGIDAAFIPGGRHNEVFSSHASASGYRALAWMKGQQAQSSGYFTDTGDAQTSVFTLGGLFTGLGNEVLCLNYSDPMPGLPVYPKLGQNGIYVVWALVTAWETGVTAGNCAAFRVMKVFERRGGNVVPRGNWVTSPNLKEVIYDDGGVFNVIGLTASGDNIQLTVNNSRIGNTTYWVARVEMAHFNIGGKVPPM